jgi:hypothetical protein
LLEGEKRSKEKAVPMLSQGTAFLSFLPLPSQWCPWQVQKKRPAKGSVVGRF